MSSRRAGSWSWWCRLEGLTLQVLGTLACGLGDDLTKPLYTLRQGDEGGRGQRLYRYRRCRFLVVQVSDLVIQVQCHLPHLRNRFRPENLVLGSPQKVLVLTLVKEDYRLVLPDVLRQLPDFRVLAAISPCS
jgi:hypothetical protein